DRHPHRPRPSHGPLAADPDPGADAVRLAVGNHRPAPGRASAGVREAGAGEDRGHGGLGEAAGMTANAVAVAVAVAVAFPLLKIPPPFRRLADPKGAAHGCAAFFYKTWMSCRKIPSSMKSRVCSWHKAFFFASFLLTPIKRNEVAEGESP